MGARSRARLSAGMAVALLVLAPLSGASVGRTQVVTEPPIEARAGTGVWGMRVACIGCVALWVYIGSSNPALMIYHAIRNPPLVEGCALACLQAIT